MKVSLCVGEGEDNFLDRDAEAVGWRTLLGGLCGERIRSEREEDQDADEFRRSHGGVLRSIGLRRLAFVTSGTRGSFLALNQDDGRYDWRRSR